MYSAGDSVKHFMYRHFRYNVVVVQEGTEPLTRCDYCRMHITAGLLITHRRTVLCDKNTQIRWRRRDVEIASMFPEATSTLTEEG